MMMSTKRSLQSVTLVLVVFTVFTVSLTENLQIADGFTAMSSHLEYRMQVGDTQLLTWGIINDNQKDPLYLEMYATGPGSELFVFEEDIVIEPGAIRKIEIFVQVPEDHPDNREYHPQVFAKKTTPSNNESGSKIKINIQHVTKPIIFIGDNPVYFAPEIVKQEAGEEEESVTSNAQPKEEVEKVAGETMQEKLDRIKASNLANQLDSPDDVWEESFEDEAVTDYVPEPGMDTKPIVEEVAQEEDGGCLIATAAFGSELAPQVQLLREIRDNQLMGTSSGIAFMSGFNSLYYSFSPIIADMERENPAFKELVKITITPMISTLSVMEYADSDDKVLGLGIGVILMNLGMYVGLPTFGILKLIQFKKN